MNFREMLSARGLSLAQVEVSARVSIATTRRALRGTVPGDIYVLALARLLRVSEAEMRAAIVAMRKPAPEVKP